MERDRTCKRCSVKRVNALVEAYRKAHGGGGGGGKVGGGGGDGSNQLDMHRLREVVKLCRGRGYQPAAGLLQPGLNGRRLRALCWNVSSFLQDREVERILNLRLDT